MCLKYITDILAEVATWCNHGITPIQINYGALYNWDAATDVRNICSAGWHVPTNAEIITLSTYLDAGTNPLVYGNVSLIAGEYLKETGINYWANPNLFSSNSVNFNARGSGQRLVDGTFTALNAYFIAWASSLYAGYPVRFDVYNSGTNLVRSNDYHKKGKSLRPLKDSTILTHSQTGIYTDPSGDIYRTICIGTQEWVADNIKTRHYRNGDLIPVVTGNAAWAALVTGAMCYYNNDINNA